MIGNLSIRGMAVFSCVVAACLPLSAGAVLSGLNGNIVISQGTTPDASITIELKVTNLENDQEQLIPSFTSPRGEVHVPLNIRGLGSTRTEVLVDGASVGTYESRMGLTEITDDGTGGGTDADSRVRIRGYTGQSAVLQILDSALFQRDASDVFGSLSPEELMPELLVERVDLLREGVSTLYGRDAVAGVVNIVTRKKPEDFDFQSVGNGFELSFDATEQPFTVSVVPATLAPSLLIGLVPVQNSMELKMMMSPSRDRP